MNYNKYLDTKGGFELLTPEIKKLKEMDEEAGIESKDCTAYLETDEYELYKWFQSLINAKKIDKLSFNLHLLALPKQTRTKFKDDILSGSLFTAIEKKSISTIKYLIKKGAEVTDEHLELAHKTKFDEATNLFLDMGIKFNYSTMSNAINELDVDSVDLILNNGYSDISLNLCQVIWSLETRLYPEYQGRSLNSAGTFNFMGKESYLKLIEIYNKFKNVILEKISTYGIKSKTYTKKVLGVLNEIDSKLATLKISNFRENSVHYDSWLWNDEDGTRACQSYIFEHDYYHDLYSVSFTEFRLYVDKIISYGIEIETLDESV